MENQPSNPVVIVQTGGQTTPSEPESNNSPAPGTSEQSALLQLGAVLEAHRTLTTRTEQNEARLEALDSRVGEVANGQAGIMSRLDQLLVQSEPEVEADVVEVIPERAEESEPEPEPVKPRHPVWKALFG